jgi:beta-glucosidase
MATLPPPPPGVAAALFRAERVVAQMTLDEKIGQTVLFTSHFTSTGPADDRKGLDGMIREGKCGSVLNALTVDYIRGLQKTAVESTRLHLPLLFGFDVIHGYHTVFPIPLGEAASWDLEAIEHSARIAATEASAAGLNWTYAPMVDIARDPRWGRVAEGAGEDPYLGAQVARARVHGFQGRGWSDPTALMACVKHFAGYGAAEAGRDYNTVDLSERTLREVYFPPFQAALEAGAFSVMAAFSDLNGVPATANRYLLTHTLREEWKFPGFVVTDYDSIRELLNHGVARDNADAARQALDAGVDMDMQSGIFLEQLKSGVRRGAIPVRQIDQAAIRIVAAKILLGLVDDPYRYCDPARERAQARSVENLEAADEVARRSIVLLKNERSALPLRAGTKLAVIGPLADDAKDLLGSWAGAGTAENVETLAAALRRQNGGAEVRTVRGCDVLSNDRSGFGAALAAAENADTVVLALGESAGMTGEAASRTRISLPGLQSELLYAVKQLGKRVVLVLFNGRPLAIEAESNAADAVVEAWFPGSAGGGPVAEVLLGKFNPGGKLPISFPRNVGQVPIYYSFKNTGRPFDPDKPTEKYHSAYLDAPNSPLYAFGFGLSYTQFECSAPRVDRVSLRDGETATVSIEVTNTGSRAGTEVVQCYLHQAVASVTRPVMELKGFKKIELKAGETRRVEFPLGHRELAFWRRDMSWGTEPSPLIAYVGTSSQNLQPVRLTLTN